MKLFRFGQPGHERPGVMLTNQQAIDVSAFGEDFGEDFFATDGLARLATWLINNAPACPVVGPDERFGSCIKRPSKIVCVGLNYAKHALESSMPKPTEPIL